MYRVRVERLINKPIEQVFEQLVDHANYTQFPGVVLAKLLEPGKTEPNGEGALRFIDAGSMQLTERIVAFERPNFMAYHIESSKPFFIDLEKGQVTLSPEGEATRVVWISEGRIKMPLIGAIMDKMFEKQFARAFGSILKHISNT
jgi:uncharacterized protein YndB with AHSA1/START domain